MKTTNISSMGSRAMMLLPLAFAMAGCQGTLHTRWAQQADTYDYWAPQIAALPIEVHGAAPGLSHAETVARIPQGTTATRFTAKQPANPSLAAMPRVVLYVGGDTIPTDHSYCSTTPDMRAADNGKHGVMLAAALCDGPRLIDRSRRVVSVDHLGARQLRATVKSLESHLLFGLTVSQAQTPTEDNNG